MKIAILGYGKMGKTIERLALTDGHEIVLKIGRNNTDELTKINLQKADVAIDFSLPSTAFDNIQACLKAGTPVVSGTTGWLERLPEINTLCELQKGAFIYASNFSVGVNIFFELNRQLAKMMNPQVQYDVNLEEIHHTQKLDAPSGTALTLAKDVAKVIDRKSNIINELASTPSDLSIISKRIEKVPGTHYVKYESPIDEIEIKHVAHSREGFAGGAILAAQWLIGKTGIYTMKDVLFGDES